MLGELAPGTFAALVAHSLPLPLQIVEGDAPPLPERPGGGSFSAPFAALVAECLRKPPDERPTATQARTPRHARVAPFVATPASPPSSRAPPPRSAWRTAG